MGLNRMLLGLCLALGSQGALAAESQPKGPAGFAVQVPLGLSAQGPWFRLDLPLALQLSARLSDLQDLRIFDARGVPLAFSLLQAHGRVTSDTREHAVRWFPLYGGAGSLGAPADAKVQVSQTGSIIDVMPGLSAGQQVLRGWLIDTSAIGAPLSHMTMDWNGERDGFQHFSIEASDDLQQWRSWGEAQVAKLTFADQRIEQHETILPAQPARYLRLLWRNPQVAPLLNMVHVFSRVPCEAQAALSWSAPLAGRRGAGGEFVWALPALLEVERVQLDIAQPNSLAPVTVWGRGSPTEPWRLLQSGLFYRLEQGAQESVRDELPLPGEPVRELMIRVDDRGGGLGTAAPALRVAVQPQRVVFLANEAGPFTLAIGNERAQPASLALDLLLSANPKPLGEMGVARLAGTPMIAGNNRIERGAAVDWKQVALIAVLVLGLAVLAGILRGVWRRRSAQGQGSE